MLFLGTGASTGIPVIGCHCAVCKSADPRNRRSRAAVLVKYGGQQLLLDTGPDLRQQALLVGLSHLDGVILTHAHYDHIAGLDDLRPLLFHRGAPLPLLLSAATLEVVEETFHYLLQDSSRFITHKLPKARGALTFQKVPLSYCTYEQAAMEVNGFRFGNLAYVSDIRSYPDTIFEDLEGINTLVISALRFTPSTMHFTVDEAIAFGVRSGAERVWLTHISHDLDHVRTEAYLPGHVRLAYDGLAIPFSLPLDKEISDG